MNRILVRACAAAAAGVALSTVAVTGASASGGGGVTIHPGALRPAGSVAGRGGGLWSAGKDHALGQITAATTNNQTTAGYKTTVAAGSATSAAATFTVPRLSCTTATRVIAPLAGMTTNNNKIFSVAAVHVGCVKGKAVYYPLLVVNGNETNYTTTHFAAGDVINLSTSVTTSATTVQLTDVTKNVTKTRTGAGASATAAWIAHDAWPSRTGILGVPNFGKLAFTNCLIDGKALGHWHPQAYQRVNSHGTVQIATGGLWPGGTAFTTHYRHS
jgi:hypothetical protein